MSEPVEFSLPYPPSVNGYWRAFRGRVVVSSTARKFQREVREVVARAGRPSVPGAVRVAVELRPPPGKVRVRKKCMPPIGPLQGTAIRLFPAGEVLGVAEGIETAIAAYELFGTPTWATYSARNLEAFEPPEGVRAVVVYGDTDESFTGQASAYLLAKKLKTKGYEVTVRLPPQGDWLDVLNHQQEAVA